MSALEGLPFHGIALYKSTYTFTYLLIGQFCLSPAIAMTQVSKKLMSLAHSHSVSNALKMQPRTQPQFPFLLPPFPFCSLPLSYGGFEDITPEKHFGIKDARMVSFRAFLK